MNTNFVNRNNDEEIINIVRTVMDNGTGKAETPYEHILIKLMQLRGTPMTSFDYTQERVDFHYKLWLEESGGNLPQTLGGPILKKIHIKSALTGRVDELWVAEDIVIANSLEELERKD